MPLGKEGGAHQKRAHRETTGHPEIAQLWYGQSIGTGAALEVALEDDRKVVKVVWMTQPIKGLPLVLRSLEVVHSFLIVTVEDADGVSVEEYVIEKCDTKDKNVEGDILVSWWLEARTSVCCLLLLLLQQQLCGSSSSSG